MSRTTVNIDDALLEDAQRLLGTHGVTETINSAMSIVLRRAALDDFSLDAFDIDDADLNEARQDRTGHA